MTSKSRQKGYRTVAKGRQWFEDRGYLFANLEKSGKFAKDKDLFGRWDCLAVKGKSHIFIQFKTNKKGQKWKDDYKKFGKKHGSRTVKYEIWNWFDRKGFVVTHCGGDENEEKYVK